jgi:hypothetical protein
MREGVEEALISVIWVIRSILHAPHARGGRGGAD